MTVFPMMARVLMALGCMWLCSHMPGKKAAVALAASIDRATLVPGPPAVGLDGEGCRPSLRP